MPCHPQSKWRSQGVINTAEEEALHVGTKVADKMAHEAHEAAEKADNLKNKVHNFADAKK